MGDFSNQHDLQLHLIDSLSQLKQLRGSWKQLVTQVPSATPFQTWEWNYWIAKYKQDRIQLRIVVAKNNVGETIGIAPLWLRNSAIPQFTLLEFIGSRHGDYLDILCTDPYRKSFTARLKNWIEANHEWYIIQFRNLREDSLNYFREYMHDDPVICDVCPRVILPKNIDSYYSTLPGQLRSILHRKGERLKKGGRLSFGLPQSPDQLHNDLTVFFDLHQLRQRSKGERGRFFNQQWKKNFIEMSFEMQSAGILRLGFVRIDGKPAASHYNFRLGDQEFFYLTGMNPSMAKYSPGNLLHYWMIEKAIEDGVTEYDFLRGAETYKNWWATETNPIYEISRTRSVKTRWLWRGQRALRSLLYRNRLIKKIYLAVQE
jgi:CelD/BcsL family acetyltransferase involved in cellulose biosynthesis